MGQVVEVTTDSLSKAGEELCGDWIKVVATPQALSVALSDGLGSGVKANILATLTTEIAMTMLAQGVGIEQVVETLADTLPECRVRHLAYATFAVLRVVHGREAYLVEYDSPPLILVQRGRLVTLPMTERQISGRTIRECQFTVERGDYMVMLSDGYLHAGVGGLYRMGWGWRNIATAVERWAATQGDSYQLTQALRRTCLKLSNGKPGDDATVAGMWVRPRRTATVLTGPPADSKSDDQAVARLLAEPGARAICGGTTAQMVARVLGKPLRVTWGPAAGASSRATSAKLPPIAELEGIDLVTEGILTLSATADLLRRTATVHDLPAGADGGIRLARLLLNADAIHFIVGDAINPQQLADVVRGKPMRQLYLEEIIAYLGERGKHVTVEHL